DRTNLFSARYLDPNGLGALGRQFFTTPKDARIQGGCQPDNPCRELSDPLRFSSLDIFFSTFKRDTTGAFARHTLIVLDDRYKVTEDKSLVPELSDPLVLVNGQQGAWLYSYETVRPTESGDWEWGFSWLSRKYSDGYRDTLPRTSQTNAKPWYPPSGAGANNVDNLIGEGGRKDRQFILSGMWSPYEKTFGALPSYGVELERTTQARDYRFLLRQFDQGRRDSSINFASNVLDHTVTFANAQYRLRWNLGGGRTLEGSVGAA